MDIDFGPYRLTERTTWRHPRDGPFRPRYDVSAAVHEHLRAVERLDQEVQGFEAAPALARRILTDALTRNAYGTASIEGNPLSLQEVQSLLAHAPGAGDAQVPDEREILNWAAFMDTLDDVPVPSSVDDVRALHARLFEGVLGDAGAMKTQPNFIGRHRPPEVVFVPTPPEHAAAELQAALDWLHAADEQPLVRAMVFFDEFQGVHPFRDGNGRLGRALFTLFLHHAGYRGVRYALVDYTFNQEREAYFRALQDVQAGDWDFTPWLSYMAGVLHETYEAALRRFLWQDQAPTGLNDRQMAVADWFARLARGRPGRRVKFGDVHHAFPHVPRRTLQADMAGLVDAGVILREGERKGTTYALAPSRPAAR